MCTRLWMSCANAQGGGAMPGGMPGEPWPVLPVNYGRKRGVTRVAAGKIPKGLRPYWHQMVIHM